MAPTYKLTYFNARGVAEPIRYIFSYAGVAFEDVRYELSDWAALKPLAPFGKLPTLEIDGKVVHQSQAICRYLATLYKLNGDTLWDAMQADIVVDTLGDLKTLARDYFRLAVYTAGPVDEEDKAKKRDGLMKETMPYYMAKFEDVVKQNGGYFVNGKLTWADFWWTANMESMAAVLGDEIFTGYPSLIALKDKILSLPAIKTWAEKRPKTLM